MSDIFEAYMQSDFAKAELHKITAQELAKYPKALPRYGAIFKMEKRPEGVRLAFYLRAGAVVKLPEGEELSGKEKIFDYLHGKYPQMSDIEIHKIIQNIMMQPSTQKYIRKKTGRSPVLVYETTLQSPKIGSMNAQEIKEFLIKLLHNGVFDPILNTDKEKGTADIAELGSRLKEIESDENKFYEPKGRDEEPVGLEDFLPKSEAVSESKVSIKTAQDGTTWWYINEDDMLIEGPFAGLEPAMDAQDRKLGTMNVFEEELDPELALTPEIIEEELAMAAGLKDVLRKLAQLSDELDAKGETPLADEVDKVIKACYDVTPAYDAVKEFHPKGGSPDTRDGHGKVVPGDTRTETITEQQKADLAIALKNPTGKEGACKSCGLTHIASVIKVCPSCDVSL